MKYHKRVLSLAIASAAIVANLHLAAIPAAAENLSRDTIACYEKSDFEDLVLFIMAKNNESRDEMLKSKRCFLLEKGSEVALVAKESIYINLKNASGKSFWTFSESIGLPKKK